MTEPTRSQTHVSLRIPTSLLEDLRFEAEKRLLSFNALSAQILARHVRLDRVTKFMDSLSVPRRLVSTLLETAPERAISKVAVDLATQDVPRIFVYYNLDMNVPSLVSRYLEPLAQSSGWFRFNHVTGSSGTRMVFEHELGPKWDLFLGNHVGQPVKTVVGAEPRVELRNGLIVLEF